MMPRANISKPIKTVPMAIAASSNGLTRRGGFAVVFFGIANTRSSPNCKALYALTTLSWLRAAAERISRRKRAPEQVLRAPTACGEASVPFQPRNTPPQTLGRGILLTAVQKSATTADEHNVGSKAGSLRA
jgi:hypothetical protein